MSFSNLALQRPPVARNASRCAIVGTLFHSPSNHFICPCASIRRHGDESTQSHRQARRQPSAHAPDDAEHKSDKARRRAGPDIPTSAEIREGTNRISASKLQESANFLQVPVTFFFEGAPSVSGTSKAKGASPSPAYVTDFLATRDGLALIKAFMRIKDAKLRRHVVNLVEGIADQ
jgi:hypothetical protein